MRRLRSSRLWKDKSEGAEEVAVERRFQSEAVRVEEDMVLGLFLVQSLCFLCYCMASGCAVSPLSAAVFRIDNFGSTNYCGEIWKELMQ